MAYLGALAVTLVPTPKSQELLWNILAPAAEQ